MKPRIVDYKDGWFGVLEPLLTQTKWILIGPEGYVASGYADHAAEARQLVAARHRRETRELVAA